MTGPQVLNFLGVERLISSPSDWNRSDWPKLWLYNAHYFDDLAANQSTGRVEWHRSLIAKWIAENVPGMGNGWEPYPTSLRIVNWVKWLLAGNRPVPGMVQSLAVQARWLRSRLEYHLLGNHLWANAKALVFAGYFFSGPEGAAWREHGVRVLSRELREQVLPDGGHLERSPMYHAILTEDLLDLVQLAGHDLALPEATHHDWRESAMRMLEWANVMAHPDGDVAFFNDAAFGIAPELKALTAYASNLGLPVPSTSPMTQLLKDSGYARMEAGPAVLLADVAPVGPDYLPGHAHADTLSFELSVRGERMLVNGGTSTYENGTQRWHERGTAAHNTVVVDDQDSSEVWAAFRVARRARVHDVSLLQQDGVGRLSAWHDGYQRLPGKVAHHRIWQLDAEGLVVEDVLSGTFREAVANYLFAPGAVLEWHVEGGEGRVEPAVWHPRFGTSVETNRLVVRFTGTRCRVHFSWS